MYAVRMQCILYGLSPGKVRFVSTMHMTWFVYSMYDVRFVSTIHVVWFVSSMYDAYFVSTKNSIHA